MVETIKTAYDEYVVQIQPTTDKLVAILQGKYINVKGTRTLSTELVPTVENEENCFRVLLPGAGEYQLDICMIKQDGTQKDISFLLGNS